MPKLPDMQVIRVLRTDVYVDPGINSRKAYKATDETDRGKAYNREITRLADDIKVSGVIHKPVLLPMRQAGEDYAKRKEGYLLVVGFRRQSALDLLGQEEASYSIAPTAWTLADAKIANAAENLVREDLTSFEFAAWCADMKETEGMTGEQISKMLKARGSDESRKPVSDKHILNLIQCVKELHPTILAAWEADHSAASLRFLIELKGIKDQGEQLAAWKNRTEPKDKDKGEGKGEGAGGGKGEGETRKNRPTASNLAVMIEAVKKSGHSDDYKKGAIAALYYAMGTKENIPGVKVEEEPKAEGKGKGKGGKGSEGKGEGAGAAGSAPSA